MISELRNRILICVYAYAYEIEDKPLVEDSVYDSLSKSIYLNARFKTDIDKWFRSNFQTYTSQWIHDHPNPSRLAEIAKIIRDSQKKVKNKAHTD